MLPIVRRTLPALLLVLVSGACAGGGAPPSSGPEPEGNVVTRILKRGNPFRVKAVRPGGKYVLIDINTNELRFMDGERVVWSAPVGTGTGLRLRGADGDWDFATPTGTFQVEFKELDPTWIVPDWYFVERKLPVPPENSPKRRLKNELGVAAVYFGEGLAIHGTDKPQLLGQRVSHGCVRLADENALRLFHNVQVGTPVVIVGRQRRVPETDVPPISPPSAAKRTAPKPPAGAGLSTPQLLTRLDRQMASAGTSSAWTQTASAMIARGISTDTLALRGLLMRAGRSGNDNFEREYATFLADAFSRGGTRTVIALGKLDRVTRERAAGAIVDAVLELYHGPATSTPWPTERIPRWRLGPIGRQGWQALETAEAGWRKARPRSAE
ncbi:MAG: L,D-transpeptidase [Gemmatimonadota bacterium]|nr:L,D-transpeptidase [Gemmatimonadota bacterium]